MKFLIRFIKDIKGIGAVAPSSKSLAKRMVENIDFKKSKIIVEYGPGTGVFTNFLIEKKNHDCVLLLIENDDEFYKLNQNKYKNRKDIIVKKGCASNLKEYLNELNINKADYIISGLPFSNFKKSLTNKILNTTKENLKKNGKFILFQYTLLKKSHFENYFHIEKIKKVWKNIPPAYALTCVKN